MSGRRATLLNSHFRALFRILPTSSANAKLRIWSTTEGVGSRQFLSSFHSCIPSKPMSDFLCKSILFGCSTVRTQTPPTILGFLRNPDFLTQRWSSSSSDQQSFTVSYLVNSVGMSPESALSASKHVNFETPEKADKVINLFKKYGFTRTQISILARRRPIILSSDAEKTILPKLEFFEAIGISGPEMAKVLSAFPTVLGSSLDKQIMPAYDFFSILFKNNKKLNLAVKRCPDILAHKNCGTPHIDLLRGYGVPDSKIATLVLSQPRILVFSLDRLREIGKKVVEMGFDASTANFVIAVRAFWSMSKSTWESKVDAYKKWGLSEEEILKAFTKYPWCMKLSEGKITASMDFFINQMGWRPCHVAKWPIILTLSLKKRVIPRCSVFQVLLSKDLVEKEVNLSALLMVSEERFLQKFVVPYEEEAPELLKLYMEKLDLSNGPLTDESEKC